MQSVSRVRLPFASYELEVWGRQSDATSGLHFSDQRTRAVAFHRDAWFGMNRGEDALGDAVILGIVLRPRPTSGSAASFSNGIGSRR